MAKVLVVNQEKCTGCRLCEMVCSVKHTGSVNPARTRIRIAKWEPEGIMVPVVCHQCADAPCVAVCPTGARSRDEELGRTVVEHHRCIGCKTCVAVCPFGANAWDPVSHEVINCDFCDGDPQCVRFCLTGALSYVEENQINQKKQLVAARQLFDATSHGASLLQS